MTVHFTLKHCLKHRSENVFHGVLHICNAFRMILLIICFARFSPGVPSFFFAISLIPFLSFLLLLHTFEHIQKSVQVFSNLHTLFYKLRARELREVLRFSLFSCPFFVFAVHSTLFLLLSTIFLTKGRKQNYARLHYLLQDNNASFNFLVSILYTQLFQQLFYSADHIHVGSLPIPVHFLMDEFANETQL